eukprot:2187989-Prymnesium_polylepis.1
MQSLRRRPTNLSAPFRSEAVITYDLTRLIAKLPAGSYFVRLGDTAVAVTYPRRSASGRALDGRPGRLLRVR